MLGEFLVRSLNSFSIFQPWISIFLEPSFRKFLDLQIVFDDNQYWLVQCRFIKRIETSEKIPNYPPNCTHFVDEIDYGVDLWVLFPKTGFPEDWGEVRFTNSTLSIIN